MELTRGPAALACFQTFLHTCSPQDRAWFAGRECRTSVCQGASLLCYTDGSFTPARGDQPALMGWAVAFFRRAEDVHDRLTCLGVASGPFPSFLQDEVHLPTAFLVECCALCYAALLNVVLFPGLDVVFVSDCVAAIASAKGGAASGSLKVQNILRGMHAFRRASSGGRIWFQHTKGHSGEVPNEIVDTASKLASHGCSLGVCVMRRPELWCHDEGQALIWAATACQSLRGNAALPPVCGGSLGDDSDHLGLQAEELIAPFVAVPATPRVLPPSAAGTLRFRLASVNVLSLLGAAGKSRDAKPVGLAMQVAKPALFSQALDKSL